mmetsp:Transcript_38130/g.92753  ORF Transcript_38130/g.92753 Transcript_38130/m.92753 type:complete len:114 (-) Transcript_38130:478-819(-)
MDLRREQRSITKTRGRKATLVCCRRNKRQCGLTVTTKNTNEEGSQFPKLIHIHLPTTKTNNNHQPSTNQHHEARDLPFPLCIICCCIPTVHHDPEACHDSDSNNPDGTSFDHV